MLYTQNNVNKAFKRTSQLPACTVNIDKHGDSDTAAYVITMACDSATTTLDVSVAPNELELIAINAYIRASIESFYKDAPALYKSALEREIAVWSAYQIGSVVVSQLRSGKLQAEHCYIKTVYVGKKMRDLQYHGWTSVILCKNQEEVKQLNSKQLYQWLEDNPDTPIYDTGYVGDVEKELTAENNMSMRERLSINTNMSIMTTAQRFKAKLGVTIKGKMIFSKKGVQTPSKAELARYA